MELTSRLNSESILLDKLEIGLSNHTLWLICLHLAGNGELVLMDVRLKRLVTASGNCLQILYPDLGHNLINSPKERRYVTVESTAGKMLSRCHCNSLFARSEWPQLK